MRSEITVVICVFVLVCSSCVLNAPKNDVEYNGLNTIEIASVNDLISFYQYAEDRIPLISGHRGGRVKGFPENSLETFANTLSYTPATFEIDPRLTKDSVIVLFHDDTLERTSNGTGRVADYTWEELQKLRLKDPDGNLTDCRIPKLEDAIRWAKGKTVLILDKKDVPMERTAQLITDMNAESYVMITVHNGADARFFYEKNPNFVFEAFVKTKDALLDYEENGIPWNHIMAYVGPTITPENREVIDMLHERGVMCMVSTAPTDDKLPTEDDRAEAYRQIMRQGVDVIESDRPIEVAGAISSFIPENSSKEKFFELQEFE
ncbi:glycerophosphodiester phosphodiesterase family protein [Parabacteroides bouchesdurhonensis]|uniref:glycerophosphodiester phosphodiesterase family protein n=1 Tax=Parabacteroides bouchesdurhonensis TaxID=1936995 RepID=UPI000E54490A|nr:glycerophosphodiester phosphodiesterase family protein [Parabacteroides bouchesdurhonensis]RHJ91163.1 glycerophosphodiester phosphodiesterase [Bacteroides sp. AM07-16]